MVQRPTISPSILGWMVEVESSSKDMIAFIENSLGQSLIMQARSSSSNSNSLKSYGIMTSAEAGKVVLIWEINILEAAHFLFFFFFFLMLERFLQQWVYTPNWIFLCYMRVQWDQGSLILRLQGLGLICTQTWASPLRPSKLLQANWT